MTRGRGRLRTLVLAGLAGVVLAGAEFGGGAVLAEAAPLPAGQDSSGAESAQRWLELTNTHTRETVRVSYRNGSGLDPVAAGQLEHVLRDHRRDAAHEMDARLYDLLYDLASSVGREPRYEIISGYRSPETNQSLRGRSSDSGVSEHSLHMEGRAIDVRLKGFPTAELRDAALRLGRGGVGYYDRSNFVHIDTGRVRHWSGH